MKVTGYKNEHVKLGLRAASVWKATSLNIKAAPLEEFDHLCHTKDAVAHSLGYFKHMSALVSVANKLIKCGEAFTGVLGYGSAYMPTMGIEPLAIAAIAKGAYAAKSYQLTMGLLEELTPQKIHELAQTKNNERDWLFIAIGEKGLRIIDDGKQNKVERLRAYLTNKQAKRRIAMLSAGAKLAKLGLAIWCPASVAIPAALTLTTAFAKLYHAY